MSTTERIYLDYAATTPMREECITELQKHLKDSFGNPSTLYELGEQARQTMDLARKRVATALNCKKDEIIFTGSGTEANNAALKGLALKETDRKTIILSEVEHDSVLQTCLQLQNHGYKLIFVSPDRNGLVSVKDTLKLVDEDVFLVTVMFANNETGVIQPVEEIASELKVISRQLGRFIYFHCDAIQVLGKIPIDLSKLNFDTASFSAHKVRGPKGVGVQFLRNGIQLEPLLAGGGQEHSHRSGTENVAGIASAGLAFELANEELTKFVERTEPLKQQLIAGISEIYPAAQIIAQNAPTLPNIVSVMFPGIIGENLLILLDNYGICVSSGSACSSGSTEPSHVLVAMDIDAEVAKSNIRFSLGSMTTAEEIEITLNSLRDVIQQLLEYKEVF